MDEERLQGARVLLVEDNAFVNMGTAEILKELGCRILAAALDVSEAFAAIKDELPDVAVLDVRLRDGKTVYPLAEKLAAQRVPIIFFTGSGVDEKWQDYPVCTKPCHPKKLKSILLEVLISSSRSREMT